MPIILLSHYNKPEYLFENTPNASKAFFSKIIQTLVHNNSWSRITKLFNIN